MTLVWITLGTGHTWRKEQGLESAKIPISHLPEKDVSRGEEVAFKCLLVPHKCGMEKVHLDREAGQLKKVPCMEMREEEKEKRQTREGKWRNC